MEQSEITTFLDDRSEAIRAKDIDHLMSFYSGNIIYFDIVPPLQYVGSAALRGRFSEWFNSYEGGIRQDVHSVTSTVNGDIAFVSMLIQSGGTLKNGQEVELWVRATSGLERSTNGWLITHEHVSLPVDLKSQKAVIN
ncbi:MAG TPA: nuclear transport factor 2 family protein [Candidatus Saccharimonadales bacterium]|nr:nuclear transport factor 2 family protein [Candidatus Saccharimonadales bacterium]